MRLFQLFKTAGEGEGICKMAETSAVAAAQKRRRRKKKKNRVGGVMAELCMRDTAEESGSVVKTFLASSAACGELPRTQ